MEVCAWPSHPAYWFHFDGNKESLLPPSNDPDALVEAVKERTFFFLFAP
jgi:hypothetical protein